MGIVQQISYFMRDQDSLMDTVLNTGKGESNPQISKRQSRYVSVTDKLFELADTGKHDHCSFVLAVVLFHMSLRALCLRVLYHRAAIAIQKRYRYIKQKGAKQHVLAPALTIQRFYRGLRDALRITRRDNAAAKIQHSYKVYRWNRRADEFLNATLKIQRVWLGAIHRKWLRHCHYSATYIQKMVRASFIRLVLDKEGSAMARDCQTEMNDLLAQKGSMSETAYSAKTAALVGKLRTNLARHRDINIQKRRMPLLSVASRIDKAARLSMRGSVQPMRLSEFEPMVFALAKMEPQLPPRYGAQRSRILNMVMAAKKELDKTLPRESNRLPHAAAKRGRAAIIARRLAKKPKLVAAQNPTVNEEDFSRWAVQQFQPTRF